MPDAPVPPAPSVSRDIGVLRAGWGYASISDCIALVLQHPPGRPWLAGFALTLAGTLVLLGSMADLFFAIGTCVIVSFLFWHLGLIPDLATLRDRAATRFKRTAYGLFALGWRGEARQWARHASDYLLLAGLATPLVVSVHSVVSLDFAIGNTPGWHSQIFPPYFVAGALLSGFAMVPTLTIPLRHAFHLHDFITEVHLDHAAKVLLATGALVAYGYLVETFMAFCSGNTYEIAMTQDRWSGAYAPVYWSMLACNWVVPQLLWWRRVRHSARALFLLSLVINLGMWMERVTIVVQSLHRDYLPSSWGLFVPTLWDWVFLLGSISAFAWLFLVFIRVLPAISSPEMRALVKESAQAGPAPASVAPALLAKAVPPSAMKVPDTRPPWALLAEFGTADELLRAARAARAQGWTRLQAYAPFHVEGLAEAVGFSRNRVAPVTFAAALPGGALGYLMQWSSAVVDYPLNIGGRPPHSGPMFVPVSFELTVP